ACLWRARNGGRRTACRGVLSARADGVVQAVGRASREPTTIDFEVAGTRSERGRLENFNVSTPFGNDLAYLLHLLETGRLDPQIGWRGPWDEAAAAAEALLARRIRGKAVLDLD